MIQQLHLIMETLYWQIEGYSEIEGDVKGLSVVAEIFLLYFFFFIVPNHFF